MRKGPGIDYGLGTANIDTKTGIRYGVIPQNDVLQAWADSSEPDYGKPEEDIECAACGASLPTAGLSWGDTVTCGCGEEQDLELPEDCEAPGFTYEAEGYEASSDEQGDIFIIKSPYYTLAAFCSPCAPGAGHLRSTTKYGVRTYCFGPEWFEDGRAPYPLWSVETGRPVEGGREWKS